MLQRVVHIAPGEKHTSLIRPLGFWADRLRPAQSSSPRGSTGTGRTSPSPFHIYGCRLAIGYWG